MRSISGGGAAATREELSLNEGRPYTASMSTLISLSGLPGVGKTTVSKRLSARGNAVHLRVDSIEAALKRSVLKIHPAEDAGYLAAASIARDNLLLGFDVIADSVNPIEITRNLFAETAAAASARLLVVEVICSDEIVHRRRVETRTIDIEGLALPDWRTVSMRRFDPWRVDRLVVDTATASIDECAAKIANEMARIRFSAN